MQIKKNVAGQKDPATAPSDRAERGDKPVRRTQAKRSEVMRARLSQAAYEVIAERGHSAFRTAMVAARAGVSQGALLHHFPTKDAVTLAAVERAFVVAEIATAKRLARKTSTIESTLSSMTDDFRAFFSGDCFWAALDITMDASKNHKLAAKIRRIVAEHRGPVYARWAAKLVGLGWTQARAAEAVRMSGALVSGLAIRTLWTDETQETVIRRWKQFIIKSDDF